MYFNYFSSFLSFFRHPKGPAKGSTPKRTASPESGHRSSLSQTATVRTAKCKSAHHCACTGNTSRLDIIPNLEKVKTVRCFWEMKTEPEVVTQRNPPCSLRAVCNTACNPLTYQQMSVKAIFLSRAVERHSVFTSCNYFKIYLGTALKY